MDDNNKPKRAKKHRSTLSVVLTILIIAAIAVGIIAAAIYFSGIRYISMNTEDGGTVKFFGRVDSEGDPLTGKLYYSSGVTAEVDMEKNTVVYSNGDTYEGGLSKLRRNGRGKLIYASGDIYEGEFALDQITGQGRYSF